MYQGSRCPAAARGAGGQGPGMIMPVMSLALVGMLSVATSGFSNPGPTSQLWFTLDKHPVDCPNLSQSKMLRQTDFSTKKLLPKLYTFYPQIHFFPLFSINLLLITVMNFK